MWNLSTHNCCRPLLLLLVSVVMQAVWVYGGLLTKTFPNSYTLRATLACTCWALLGYVAHEMVSVSVRGRQQGLAAAGL